MEPAGDGAAQGGRFVSRFLEGEGDSMERRRVLGMVGLLGATLLVLAGAVRSADQAREDNPHAGHMSHCAKACADCMRECDMCSRHCTEQVAAGKKDHMQTLGTCADCASFCAMAAHVVARQGPMANLACDGCAKACATCGTACEKFPDDEHMKRCAEECRRCEKACKEMLQHLGSDGGK
jgi:hypothetical protein